MADRRPVIAHEGAYETTPLLKGDAADTQEAAPGHSHGHQHGHAPTQAPTLSE